MSEQYDRQDASSLKRPSLRRKLEYPLEKMSQPPTLSQQPISDDPNAWYVYRNEWYIYCDAWRTYKKMQNIEEQQIEGWDFYHDAWIAHWKKLGMLWRTEPEVNLERQAYLTERRSIIPDIKQGIYPFKDIRLCRADIEWLLATHDQGRGPLYWDNEYQRKGEGLDLRGADLSQADLSGLPLACVRCGLDWSEWIEATLEQRDNAKIQLKGANLSLAHLEGGYFSKANLEETNFSRAHLEGADLYRAHLEGAYIAETYLGGASLRNAFFDKNTNFDHVILYDEKLGFTLLADVHWSDTNLSLINWAQLKMLGDEYEAQQSKRWDGKVKNNDERLRDHRMAVRANRQLAVALQMQGLNEEADRFSYRAQILQRNVFWFQMTQREVTIRQRVQKFGAWLFTWFLFLLAGYGYRPGRSIIAYVVIIFGFMGLYLLNAHFVMPHLRWDEALVLSVSSFHGRGFFTQDITLGDTYARLASVEAVIGLFIEISFIATFTQRFFGR